MSAVRVPGFESLHRVSKGLREMHRGRIWSIHVWKPVVSLQFIRMSSNNFDRDEKSLCAWVCLCSSGRNLSFQCRGKGKYIQLLKIILNDFSKKKQGRTDSFWHSNHLYKLSGFWCFFFFLYAESHIHKEGLNKKLVCRGEETLPQKYDPVLYPCYLSHPVRFSYGLVAVINPLGKGP